MKLKIFIYLMVATFISVSTFAEVSIVRCVGDADRLTLVGNFEKEIGTYKAYLNQDKIYSSAYHGGTLVQLKPTHKLIEAYSYDPTFLNGRKEFFLDLISEDSTDVGFSVTYSKFWPSTSFGPSKWFRVWMFKKSILSSVYSIKDFKNYSQYECTNDKSNTPEH